MTATAQAVEDRRREAFDALRQVAEAFAARGRLCYAASAKPALRERLTGFNETELGYASFRAFVMDAEREGRVRLVYARGGDVQIISPEQAPPTASTMSPAQTQAGAGDKRIRNDLWTAVTDLNPEQWCYDKRVDIVVTQASAPEHEDLVAIPSVEGETQERWIAEFLEQLAAGARELLEAELAHASTVPQKLKLVSGNAGVRRPWYEFRTARVMEVLEQWKAEHGLSVELFEQPQRRSRIADRAKRPQAAPRRGPEDAVRSRLHRAIDRMPASELLRISLPIEYLLDT